MKRLFPIIYILFFVSNFSFSQGVGIGTNAPDASTVLDITSNNKGLLIPRMNLVSINAILSPAKGLLVYDSIANKLMVNIGSSIAPNWQPVTGNVSNTGNAWSTIGNGGIDAANQFIGTTDDQPLRFRINNIQAGELNPVNGNISFGLRAGQSNTSGVSNTAIGTDALKFNKSGFGLVAIGDSALFNNDITNPSPGLFAVFNTAVGHKSLFSNTFGSNNTASGANALLSNTIGNINSAFGESSLLSNTTGGFNTAVGAHSLSSNTIGNFNTSPGYLSICFCKILKQ